MTLTPQEISQIATRTADEVIERMMPDIEIGTKVCDRYTGSCGRVVSITNDAVEIEPTIIKRGPHEEYLEETLPHIRAKKVNLEPDHVRRYEELLPNHELLLHSVPYSEGSPGIVVNEVVAKTSPCRCIEYRPGKKLCFSKGIIGALSDEQEEIYCPTTVPLESPGLERRMKSWMGAVETCKVEIAEIPKGERLEPWLSCMSRELAAREVKA